MIRRLAIALALMLFAAQAAWADCPSCTLVWLSDWNNVGTPIITANAINPLGAWNAAPCGNISCGSVTVSAYSGNPPWDPNGVNGTNHELDMVPGSVTVPNFGTNTSLTFGNPHKALLISFAFWYTGTLNNTANQNFFFRINDNSVPGGEGTDFATLNFSDSSGHILVSPGGTTTNAMSASTVYFVDWCIDFGTGSNGTSYLTVNGVNWLSATGLSIPTSGASNNVSLDDEYTPANFHFGAIIIGDPGSCTSTTTWTHSGVLYVFDLWPISDLSTAWSRSSGTTNYSLVNSNPPGAGYTFSSTVGQDDLLGLTLSNTFTPVAMGISTSTETTAPGDRIAIPLAKVSGSSVLGTIMNSVPAAAPGSYTPYMFSPVAGSTVPSAIGYQEQN